MDRLLSVPERTRSSLFLASRRACLQASVLATAGFVKGGDEVDGKLTNLPSTAITVQGIKKIAHVSFNPGSKVPDSRLHVFPWRPGPDAGKDIGTSGSYDTLVFIVFLEKLPPIQSVKSAAITT
ncbi:unnamed protein product [Aspergillus oryzae RIB40]|uniref:DNA, SC111 n=1 Tax=Aspergillus oryzae (strain ATCC 42149 / RIB 40) TaxID=510516 RepID=Q2U8P9_ASPOR|nr:unnamed protein product [Aspergillus oryzae RIB40]BAE62066.1 unnamed protein product [Aspergillus oryzae RIB40]